MTIRPVLRSFERALASAAAIGAAAIAWSALAVDADPISDASRPAVDWEERYAAFERDGPLDAPPLRAPAPRRDPLDIGLTLTPAGAPDIAFPPRLRPDPARRAGAASPRSGLLSVPAIASAASFRVGALADRLAESRLFGGRFIDRVRTDSAPPAAALSGEVGYFLVDVDTRRVLDRRNSAGEFVPASVAKAPTALFALDALGPEHRFATRLMVDGAVVGDRIEGDLYLVGGGDPVLDTGDLDALAQALADLGVRRVDGRFYYDASAAPDAEMIDPEQPVDATYNAATSGLSLNFNRVLTRWVRSSDGRHSFAVEAFAEGKIAPARDVAVHEDPSNTVSFDHAHAPRAVGPGVVEGSIERWTIARRHFSREGRRFLPVRAPGRHTASVFQTLAAERGLTLTDPLPRYVPGGAIEIGRVESRPLREILRSMLRYSTNLTAELVGAAATAARGAETRSLEASGAFMSSWLDARFALGPRDGAAALANHSGLSLASRTSPRAIAAILADAAADPSLGPEFLDLMPVRRGQDGAARGIVRAKTGTIYFARGLAGYILCDSGRRLAFAYFNTDLEARAAFDAVYRSGRGAKPGNASAWLNRARGVERALLARWSGEHCV